jgi:hypothetical protein
MIIVKKDSDLIMFSSFRDKLLFNIKNKKTLEVINAGMSAGEFIDITEFINKSKGIKDFELEDMDNGGCINLNIKKLSKSLVFTFTNKYDLIIFIKFGGNDLVELFSDMCNCCHESLNHSVETQ